MYIEKDPNEHYYEEAKKIVEQRKKFRQKLVSNISTSILLLVINYLTSPNFMWSYIAIAGMAVGLAVKWNKMQMTVRNGEAIAREMERLRNIDHRYERSSIPVEKRINPVNRRNDELELPAKEWEKVKKTWSDSDFV